MTPPVWFDQNNPFKIHGARTLATKYGTIDASLNSFRTAYVAVPAFATEGQFCGAAAAVGEMQAPPDPRISLEPIMVRISGGQYGHSDAWFLDGGQDYWGYRSLQTYDVLGDGNSGDGLANFVQTGSDADPWEGDIPPYPEGMQYVRLSIQFRHTHFSDSGGPVWLGDYYIELYELTLDMEPYEPGNGDEDLMGAIVCPPRPKWPYREPIRDVTVPRGGKVRRSRP